MKNEENVKDTVAPDRKKIEKFYIEINNLRPPTVNSDKAKNLLKGVMSYLDSAKNYIKNELKYL